MAKQLLFEDRARRKLQRGVKTLALRMQRHCENAKTLVEWLARRPEVSKVHYPGLESHPGHEVAARQMRDFGAMLSFELQGGFEAAKRMLERVRLITLAESLGAVQTLINHPASMTHASVEPERRAGERPGIPEAALQVTAVRLGNGLWAVRHHGKPRRRRADLRGVEQPHRFPHGLWRLLALHERLEHAVHLGRRDALGALRRHDLDLVEQARHPLSRLRRDVHERDELEKRRPFFQQALAPHAGVGVLLLDHREHATPRADEISQLATDIIVSKYFRKAGVPGTGHETSARQTVTRVAKTLRVAGGQFGGYFATPEDAAPREGADAEPRANP